MAGSANFVYPRYGEMSLAEVPNTILSFFGAGMGRPILPRELWADEAEGCDKVVMFFIDGLGADNITHHFNIPLFDILSRAAKINLITSIFPSTTSAGMTTMHTGLTPQEHGLLEWNLYFREIGIAIETLPFKPVGSKVADELLQSRVSPKILYDGPTVYSRLRDAGVRPFMFLPKEIVGSAYSSVAHKGSEVVAYSRGSDLMVKLWRLILETEGPAYFFVYWPHIDASEHEFGPHSYEHETELSVLSHLITTEFFQQFDSQNCENVLFLMTADHGQTRVLDEKVVYLEECTDINAYLKKAPSGNLILPSGHPRDVFLHIRKGKIREAMTELRRGLSDVAEITTIKEATKKGLFGFGEPSERFTERAGDILILPYDGYTIGTKGFHKKPSENRGLHGGLSREEMMIPFVAARLSKLVEEVRNGK